MYNWCMISLPKLTSSNYILFGSHGIEKLSVFLIGFGIFLVLIIAKCIIFLSKKIYSINIFFGKNLFLNVIIKMSFIRPTSAADSAATVLDLKQF